MTNDRGQTCGGPTMILPLLVIAVAVLLLSPEQSNSVDTTITTQTAIEAALLLFALMQIPTAMALIAWMVEPAFRSREDCFLEFRDFVGFAALYPVIRILLTVRLISASNKVAGLVCHTVYRDGDSVVMCHRESKAKLSGRGT